MLVLITCLRLYFCFPRSVINVPSLRCVLQLHSIGDGLHIWNQLWSHGSRLSDFQDTLVQGETPLLWPLWFRAAVPGSFSLYITVYYEMGDISSVLKYRTLRMHYDLQVCA